MAKAKKRPGKKLTLKELKFKKKGLLKVAGVLRCEPYHPLASEAALKG